jgi:hypothetical protein
MKITNAEDRLVDGKNSLDQRLAALNVHEKFPSRPNYGNRGPARVLRANYVPLSFPPDIKFCRHELSISPEAKGRKLARIIELFLEQQKLTSITDYASTLYTGGPLQDGVFPIKYRAEHESAPREGATTYKITRTFKGTLDVGQFVQNLASTTSDDTYAQKSAAIIQALNVLMNYVAKSRDYLICVGASKRFFKSIGDSFDFGDGLIARRGYFTSVRMATARILLNVNISHAAFHQEKSLITFIKRFISGHDPAQLPTYNTAQLAQHLNRLRVKVTRSLNKDEKSAMIPNYKTIYGLADPKDGRQLTKPPMVAVGKLGPTEVKFWLVKEGKYISVYDYFLNRKCYSGTWNRYDKDC